VARLLQVTDGLDWSKLLDPALGGPGEPPGRPELLELLQEERRALPEGQRAVSPKKRRKTRGKR
jgi:hypothetical protein